MNEKLYLKKMKQRQLARMKEDALKNYKETDFKNCVSFSDWLWKVVRKGRRLEREYVTEEEILNKFLRIDEITNYGIDHFMVAKKIETEEPKRKFWEELK